MVSRVMAAIVLKRLVTASRLVSSVLQSPCKMRGGVAEIHLGGGGLPRVYWCSACCAVAV